MNLLGMKDRLVKARNGIEQQTAKIILKFEKEIVDLVRLQQLFEKGIDGKGKKITPEYSPFTVAVKRIKGQDTTRVTLFDEGNLFKSFTTDYGSFILEIFPTDFKKDSLIEKYGEDIFFATVQHEEDINFKIIAPQLQIWFKTIIRA